ncbi:MAG: GxxExxY protein [Planctomycetes bacterium]|nr:GxxExxY protein [Planctomycetota bacterium]
MERPDPALMSRCDKITDKVIGAAIEVHRTLGPGLLENAYEACLVHELLPRGVSVRRQVDLPVRYKEQLIDSGYRIDLVVEDLVIIELKAVDRVLPIHEAQLMTYLRLANLPVGLLINFNVTQLIKGITRRISNISPP